MLEQRNKIFICYISGLDLRRINTEFTPFLKNSLDNYPWTEIRNLPSNELFPTIVTGVDPGKHGVWGVKLKHTQPENKFADIIINSLPDILTTTFQCTFHLTNNLFDLPAIPPRRRKKFNITRTKYKRRSEQKEALSNIGGFNTIFDSAGLGACKYFFDSSMNPEAKLINELCTAKYDIEFLELYSLDRFQQWHLDKPEEVNKFYKIIDDFLNEIEKKCRKNNIKLFVISDHGHEPIKQSFNLKAAIEELNLPQNSFTYFIEVSSARFWFHSDEAREKITAFLKEFNHGTYFTYQQLKDYGISISNEEYGEGFYYLDPGFIFFPHDFNQPLANIYFSLTETMQRQRVFNPQHRGNHGHLPGCEAERAFVLLLDKNFEVNHTQPTILDIAPSVLAVAGYEKPFSMKGKSLFKEKI